MSVQRGHLIDLRIKFETTPPALVTLRTASRRRGGGVGVADDGEVAEVEDEETKIEKMKKIIIENIYMRLESWSPIHNACASDDDGGGAAAAALREHLPSVPVHPIQCTREGKICFFLIFQSIFFTIKIYLSRSIYIFFYLFSVLLTYFIEKFNL